MTSTTKKDTKKAGRTSGLDDPAVVAGKAATEAKAAWMALPHATSEDEDTPEFNAATTRWHAAEDHFAAVSPTSYAGLFVKLRWLVKMINEDKGLAPDLDWETKHVVAMGPFLEEVTPGLAEIGWGESTVIDPAVSAFAELKAAWAAFDGLGDEEPGHGVNGDPRHAAAYKRFADARDAVYAVAPVSLAGVAAKVRGMLEHQSDAYELGPDFNIMAKSMLPFLEGAPAPTPKPDPVIVMFAEWAIIRDEATALSASDPKATDPEINERWEEALGRLDAVEDQIMETPATSMRGVAIKIRIASHYVFDTGDLDKRYATPARDIDYIEAYGGPLGADGYVISALLDAERLAGVS